MVNATTRETVEELGRLLPALRRASVRAVRAREGLLELPEAQVAVLRVLSAAPQTPAQVAERLHLARPTVSNMVRELVADGLLDRRPSPLDGRSVLLDLTARARGLLDTFRAGRGRALADAVERLPAAEQEHLHAALPAVRLLLAELLAEADSEAAGHR